MEIGNNLVMFTKIQNVRHSQRLHSLVSIPEKYLHMWVRRCAVQHCLPWSQMRDSLNVTQGVTKQMWYIHTKQQKKARSIYIYEQYTYYTVKKSEFWNNMYQFDSSKNYIFACNTESSRTTNTELKTIVILGEDWGVLEGGLGG